MYKILASWSCLELILINISDNEKLGVRERVEPSSMKMIIFIYLTKTIVI